MEKTRDYIICTGLLFSLIWICFNILKTRKDFVETKIVIKILVVHKNLFQSVGEKLKLKKLCINNLI